MAFLGLTLLYFPQKGGFNFQHPACSPALGRELFVTSATNYSHIILFALFFLISYGHFAKSRLREWRPLPVAAAATLIMSALIEVAQGMSDTGNCELRDVIPDVIGLLLGAGIVLTWKASRSRADVRPPILGDD
ncbi:MAG: VanZ family protein [Gemmatimonadota bacterium]|nr:VanZ family protein [Gemmatimonadota bacterium]